MGGPLNGRPLSIEWIAENALAILECWYLGQETGTVVAEALFGDLNPGGKLPMTFPRNVGQVACFYNKLETGRPRRIFQSPHDPRFPFGFGLSYTTFELGPPRVIQSEVRAGHQTDLRVTVTNTGDRAGDEVVQLYIRDVKATRVRPLKELRGFQRIHLKPGESRVVIFTIGQRELEYWLDGEWVVEPGEFEIMTGPNSSDLQSTTLRVLP